MRLTEFEKRIITLKKYIAVIYDNETQLRLRQWCAENHIDLTYSYSGQKQPAEAFEFHTTIFYSINDSDPMLPNGINKTPQSPVTPIGFEVLGEQRRIPVIYLESSGYVQHLRQHFSSLGFEDKWDDYQPHISLSYSPDNDVDIDHLILPRFPLIFDKLEISDIDE